MKNNIWLAYFFVPPEVESQAIGVFDTSGRSSSPSLEPNLAPMMPPPPPAPPDAAENDGGDGGITNGTLLAEVLERAPVSVLTEETKRVGEP